MNRPDAPKRFALLHMLGPGVLVAATGVGAGDLATASLAGSRLGVAIAWAAVLGAFMKFVLNEGLARWQLATGTTILEGCVCHLGRPFQVCFLVYLLVWSFFVGAALMGACGVTLHAIFPILEDASKGKIAFGILASAAGVLLVRIGGYGWFARVMKLCTALMFLTVIVTTALQPVDWIAVVRGLVVPSVPKQGADSLNWTVALMGGIGGTLTVLCYGYWIREEGRDDVAMLNACRVDLAVGYSMTALFGIGMVIIGSQIVVEGKGAGLMVALANQLAATVGTFGKWAFLIGAFGAVFTSLLGVWQSVPYVFADFIRLSGPSPATASPLTSTASYRLYLYGIAAIPIAGLLFDFSRVQKYYAYFGACFMPFLAIILLILNGRASWVGADYRNRPLTICVLLATLGFFIVAIRYGSD